MKHNYTLYLFIFLLLIIVSFLFAIHKENFADKKSSTTIITRTRTRPVFYPVYSSPTVITTTPGTVITTRTSTVGAIIAFIIIIGIIILIVYLSKGGYSNSNYNTETIVIHKGGIFKKK